MEGYATLVEGALTDSGRPRSAYRAMVLRPLGIEGKLPDYSDLDASDSWLGGSVAYLVGSAYLEWLAEKDGAAALPRLWTAMTSLGEGGFDGAFRSVFGDSPRDALRPLSRGDDGAGDRRGKAPEGAMASSTASRRSDCAAGRWRSPSLPTARDCSRGGTRRLTQTFLAIWPATASASLSGRARWTLPRSDGFSASDPRWMPDGRSVLFARRAPDAAGVLRWDLHRWDYEAGRVRTITRGADVADADPEPGGAWAVAVRSRFGKTTLERVDLAGGRVTEIPVTLPVAEDWPVWSHPRVSPDGRRIAALVHAGRRWRLVTLPASGGAAREVALDAPPVSAPAWSADGARLDVAVAVGGIWNVVAADAAGGSPPAILTRVTGGAFAPAPAPDGTALFFLDFGARGVSVRRLPLGPALSAGGAPPEGAGPVLPPAPVEPKPFSSAAVTLAGAVRRLVDASGAAAPRVLVRSVRQHRSGGRRLGRRAGSSAPARDRVRGRRRRAARRIGRGRVPRIPGGGHGAAVLGDREAREPGSRPAARVRRGAVGRLSRRRLVAAVVVGPPRSARRRRGLPRGSVRRGRRVLARPRIRGGEARLSPDPRTLGFRRGRRPRGIARRDGGRRLAAVVGRRNARRHPSVPVRVRVRRGPATPPARPRASTSSRSAERRRRSCRRASTGTASRAPLSRPTSRPANGSRRTARKRPPERCPWPSYAEWMRAWNAGAARPDPVRVVGAEVRLERLIPPEYGRDVTFHVGVGWISSDAPSIHAARGYAQLVVRP